MPAIVSRQKSFTTVERVFIAFGKAALGSRTCFQGPPSSQAFQKSFTAIEWVFIAFGKAALGSSFELGWSSFELGWSSFELKLDRPRRTPSLENSIFLIRKLTFLIRKLDLSSFIKSARRP
jgi:hypothetical protein